MEKLITKFALFIFVHLAPYCYSQDSYDAQLKTAVEEIRNSKYFNNGIVMYGDGPHYGYFLSPWKAAEIFYQGDVVVHDQATIYRALKDTKSENPSTSPKSWLLTEGPHPYLFLRDVAKTKDLQALLVSDHPYLRTYAVGALARRKGADLFDVVVRNLPDTTRMNVATVDEDENLLVGDVMLWYTIDKFGRQQKDAIKKVLLNHTKSRALDEMLLFHKPDLNSYQAIRKLAETTPFAVVALSRYRRQTDIELIKKSFERMINFRGFEFYYMAIESFPDMAFKKDLIYRSREVKMEFGMSEKAYYFCALAAYHDPECLQVLEAMVDQGDNIREESNRGYYLDNLKWIYKALNKHYAPMYAALLKKIESKFSDKSELSIDPARYRPEMSPWNY